MMLSIIIPFYNVHPYTDELLDVLSPQITPDVEVILIDDGSKIPYHTDYEWCQVYRQRNKGVSAARNAGLTFATGDYIAFIDADDLVADDYIRQILNKIPFDYLEMSWKSLPGGQQFEYKLNTSSDRLSNPSSVTRVFKRSYIGDVRFNEQKDAAEDAEFIKEVCKPSAKVAVVTSFMYYYRTTTPNSLTKRYMAGDTDTQRIIYHYNHVTADMVDLLEEVKQENKTNEVYVLTYKCDLPDLYKYANVMQPCRVRGTEIRGEPYSKFIKINAPQVVQVVIYTSQKHISGIYTWIYSFCRQMYTQYEITVLHEGMEPDMIERLLPYADVRLNGYLIKCKTLLMMRIGDEIPACVHYETSIQIVHSTHLDPTWELPTDRDEIIPISKAVQRSWNLKHKPILNLTYHDPGTLHLVSATRLKTPEKGLNRMKLLAEKMNAANIKFIWDCYSDMDPNIKGITYHEMVPDVRPYIRNADYLVQLSDNGEGFCYSIVEALEEGTPVLTTQMDVLSEVGFIENKHGYTFSFNMDGDVNRIRTIPKVDYTYNNEPIKEQWGAILGEPTANDPHPHTVVCTQQYRDTILDRIVVPGEQLYLNPRRAGQIIDAQYGKLSDNLLT